jgi:parallel beta-helix repeat protein
MLATFGVVTVLAGEAGATPSDTLKVTTNTTLSADFTGYVVIAKDDVTLDCNGHRIIGSGGGRGVSVEKRRGVTVRNCDVSNFATGVWITSTSASRFEGIRSHHNAAPGGSGGFSLGAGFWMQSSSGNVLVGNSAQHNSVDGIDAFNSADNLFEGNQSDENGLAGWFLGNGSDNNTLVSNSAAFNRNERGFIIADGASNNFLTGNTAQGNGGCGFSVAGNMHPSVGNVLSGNAAGENACGFALSLDARDTLLAGNIAGSNDRGFIVEAGARNNTLTGNTANDNEGAGVELDAADANVITLNTANHNGFAGIAVLNGAANNLFDSNSAAGNGIVDALQDLASTTTGNIWTNNIFGTTINIP